MSLPNYSPCMTLEENSAEEELISSYFKQGYSNQEIIEFLKLHGIFLSLSTLKRRMQVLKLARREAKMEYVVSDDDLKRAIEQEIAGSGCFIGYRKMWARLRKRGVLVKRDRVMIFLKELDPEGVESRKRKRLRRRVYHAKGPNFIWHIDGHDKLKPYGFSVHACIDGFSRRLIWLEIGPTNKNPDVIAKYYLDSIKQVGGVPRKVRSDDGTENCLIEAIHTCLRSDHSDDDAGLGCFAIGRSTSNQRIEAYWSHLVKDGPGWWMILFKDLVDLGLLNTSDQVHIECIRFCFMEILRKELHEVSQLWNEHIISSSKFGNSSGPRGKPDCMYFLPHLYSTDDYKVPIDPCEADEFIDDSAMSVQDFSDDFAEFASIVMDELQLQKPNNAREGLNLYIHLIKEAEKL